MGTYPAAIEPPDDRARLLLAVAKPVLAAFAGEEDLAARHSEAALAHPDPWVRAATLLFAGVSAENNGEADATRDHLAAALRGFEEVGDRWGASVVLVMEAGGASPSAISTVPSRRRSARGGRWASWRPGRRSGWWTCGWPT
ncbi:MAG: hypothetical protein U0S48_11050 [Solirubrobacteraceae bacterium]